MRRREFITLLGGAAATWPLAARAQQSERMRRIGVLMSTAADDPEGRARIAALLGGLQQLGWTDGRNAQIEVRWPRGAAEARQYAAELVALAPDVILAQPIPPRVCEPRRLCFRPSACRCARPMIQPDFASPWWNAPTKV